MCLLFYPYAKKYFLLQELGRLFLDRWSCTFTSLWWIYAKFAPFQALSSFLRRSLFHLLNHRMGSRGGRAGLSLTWRQLRFLGLSFLEIFLFLLLVAILLLCGGIGTLLSSRMYRRLLVMVCLFLGLIMEFSLLLNGR